VPEEIEGKGFIIEMDLGDHHRVWVCARPGWLRKADGTFERDGSSAYIEEAAALPPGVKPHRD